MDPTTLIAMDTLFTKNIRKRLDLASPTPLYHQLFVLLKGLILDGTLLFSQQMPTEEQLAQIFSVSRITAKRAMDELGQAHRLHDYDPAAPVPEDVARAVNAVSYTHLTLPTILRV